jgi:hypothetical protein
VNAVDPVATADPAPTASIGIALLSHTNAGKTTLARTLLRRDIGEVADRAHVTEVAESHALLGTDAGDELVLWDTPGFGDSLRLARRLEASGNPVGWFLSAVWDRWTDRPFWCSQQAMRTARESTDVVLYVANAAEDPAVAGYLEPELRILEWLGRPVLVLLNQLGERATPAEVAADLARWRTRLEGRAGVAGVLPFDAFARCWVQEHVLLAALAPLLPPAKRAAFGRVQAAWRARDLAVLERAVDVLARQLAALAADRETLAPARLQQRAKSWLARAAGREVETEPEVAAAQEALARRLDAAVRESTDGLVRLHGLAGHASAEILQRLGSEFAVERGVDAGSATLVGGIVSGALGGLAADVAAGGLTFGAGALLGGVLGALGARGAVDAWNTVRGGESGAVRWSPSFLDGRVAAALARYLAVAHFGRGRGEFRGATLSPEWGPAIESAIAARRPDFAAVWALASQDGTHDAIAACLRSPLRASLLDMLRQLYPDAITALRLD